jgi:histidyl-tRNA synthetase
MTEKRKFHAVRGVRDILPPDTSLWNWFEATARDVLETFNFREIRVPVLEETELFARSVGAETDIVSKEMYTFTDRDETAISLRPEATASVVRAYIEHGMQMLPGLVKLYYAGPMFRRERPQKGRYRQFYQIGAEVLGATDHPAIDAELIEMLTVLLERCKLENWTLLVNSIGDTNCRPAYVALLREELRKVKDQLGPDSQRRIETNPLRVLDSKLPEEQPIIAKLPMISDHLCDPCREHFVELRRQLDLRSIPYRVEPRLVRGLDYYMRTTFEITSPHLGAQNALAGGGRYDGLSEMLGGPPAKGIGFALGQDRFIEVIQAAGRIDATRALDAFIVWMGATAYPAAVRLAGRLRQEGLCVEVPAEEPKLRKALSLAERLGARFAVIIGENEVQSGEFTVKRFADGEQRKLAEADVAAFVKTSVPVTRETESKSEPGV